MGRVICQSYAWWGKESFQIHIMFRETLGIMEPCLTFLISIWWRQNFAWKFFQGKSHFMHILCLIAFPLKLLSSGVTNGLLISFLIRATKQEFIQLTNESPCLALIYNSKICWSYHLSSSKQKTVEATPFPLQNQLCFDELLLFK